MDPVTAIFILILFFGLLRRSRGKKVVIEQAITPVGVYPFVKKDFLLSGAESSFHDLLQSVIGSKYKIYLKVAMEELLDLNKNISASARPGYLKKISVDCADFVLCEPRQLKILCVIMLDDNHQAQEKGVKRDRFVDKAFQAASLPLIRFKANYRYSQQDIVTALKEGIKAVESKQVPKAEAELSGGNESAVPG